MSESQDEIETTAITIHDDVLSAAVRHTPLSMMDLLPAHHPTQLLRLQEMTLALREIRDPHEAAEHLDHVSKCIVAAKALGYELQALKVLGRLASASAARLGELLADAAMSTTERAKVAAKSRHTKLPPLRTGQVAAIEAAGVPPRKAKEMVALSKIPEHERDEIADDLCERDSVPTPRKILDEHRRRTAVQVIEDEGPPKARKMTRDESDALQAMLEGDGEAFGTGAVVATSDDADDFVAGVESGRLAWCVLIIDGSANDRDWVLSLIADSTRAVLSRNRVVVYFGQQHRTFSALWGDMGVLVDPQA